MKKYVKSKIISLGIIVAILATSFLSLHVDSYASGGFTPIKKLKTKEWTYIHTNGLPNYATGLVQLSIFASETIEEVVDVVRNDYENLTKFSGSVEMDGDFHVDVYGDIGVQYTFRDMHADKVNYMTVPTQDIEATITATSTEAYIQRIGEQLVFSGFKVNELSAYNTFGGVPAFYLDAGETYDPIIFDIVNGAIKGQHYLKGSNTKKDNSKNTGSKNNDKATNNTTTSNAKSSSKKAVDLPSTYPDYPIGFTPYNLNKAVDDMDMSKGAYAVPIGYCLHTDIFEGLNTKAVDVYVRSNLDEPVPDFGGGMNANGDFIYDIPSTGRENERYILELTYMDYSNPAFTTQKLVVGMELKGNAKIVKTGNSITFTNVELKEATGFFNNNQTSWYSNDVIPRNAKALTFENGVITF